MKFKFRTQLLLPNMVALLLMLIIALVVFFNINKLLNISQWVNHTYEVIDDSNELLMYMVDQETGMRGFAVTGEEEFLEPYKQGGEKFSSLMSQLQTKVNDNLSQVSLLRNINTQANTWRTEVAEEYIRLRRNIKKGEKARNDLFNLIKSGEGKKNMDNFRNMIENSGLSNEAQNQLILDMMNMETGLRGFLLNSREEYLEPYNSGKNDLNRHLAIYGVSQRIRNAAIDWVNSYAEKAIEYNKKAMQSESLEILYAEFSKKKGKQYMDKIREDLETFGNTEFSFLDDRNTDKERTAILTKTLLIVITLIAVIISLIIILIVTSRVMRQIGGEPDEVANISEKVANGDLTIDYKISGNATGIYKSMINMANNLKDIVINIQNAASQISVASEQLNNGSQSISSAANQQASSVEEVSSTIEEMTSSIQQNTDNAMETEKISKSASEGILKVNEQSLQAVEMNKQIAEKISIINEIAFQTNILALNAAVEAARAGEHGKGFAVVAAEVRKLAERSGVAAKEIVDFAQKSLEATENTNKALAEMLPQVQRTTQLVQEIAAASTEQSNGAGQVNNSVQELNNITQQNASASEEMASNAEELAAQGQQLNEIIEFFKVDDKTWNKKSSINKSFVENTPKSIEKIQNKGVKLDLKDGQSDNDDEYSKF